MQQNNIIRLFKLGVEEDSLAVLFTDRYLQLVEQRCTKSPVIQKFIATIAKEINEISIEKAVIMKAGFTEDDIKYTIISPR